MSRDQNAAQEMLQRSGQMGVPVITVDGNVVVGFDQARLERLIPPAAARPKRLGASVAPTTGGVKVGQVHPGTPAEKAGLRPGDRIIAVDGAAVATPDDLQARLAPLFERGQAVRLRVSRDGREAELVLTPPTG